MFSITGLVIACLIYHNAHGLPDTQIVGTYASGNHYPFQASLKYISDSNVKAYLCGGAIISKNYVITGAHCLYRLPSLFKLVVDVGRDDSSYRATYAINAIIIHPHYIPTMLYIYDIGLINLKESISFNIYISPINLISYDRDFENVDFIAIGWNTLNGQEVSIRSNLQQASELNVTGISQTTCGEKYDKYITHLHVCTQDNATCNGDAGGLLTFNGTLVGIMSSNSIMPCRDYPDVYTRVYFYQSWINNLINAR